MPYVLRAHWDSGKSWGHLQQIPLFCALCCEDCVMQCRRKESHIMYEKLKYQAPEEQVYGLKASSVTGCSSSAGTSQWVQEQSIMVICSWHIRPKVNALCFFNVTMFISFQLPLCGTGQLNLSNFPGGSHSKSLLRVSSSDRSVLDWIHEKTTTLRQVGSSHPTTRKDP